MKELIRSQEGTDKYEEILLELCLPGNWVKKAIQCEIIGLARSDEYPEREMEVIRVMAQGCRYEAITEANHISMNTVKYHGKKIL